MKKFRVKHCTEKGYRWVVRGSVGLGRYARTYFQTKEEAQTYADRKNIEFENKGTESLSVSTRTQLMAQEGEELLAPFGKTIKDAVDFYIGHLRRVSSSKTVREAVQEFLEAKKYQKRILSFRYRKDLKNRLTKFAKNFGEHLVALVEGQQIEAWLRGMAISGVTHDNYHAILSVFFGWAKKSRLTAENPIDGIRDPEPATNAPGIFTPGEAANLLGSAPSELLPYLCLSLFCGIRPEEFHKTVLRRADGKETRETISLDWRALDFRSKRITISAELAKTHRKRIVDVPDNALRWLSEHSQLSGPIAPSRFRERLEKLRKQIGLIKWPHDVLRHSFCTYHLALHQNEHLTALQAGHSPQILRKHYDAVVPREEALEFFSLMPDHGSRLLPFLAA